ncbi:class II fructose-bisphosphate aldolase [Sphingobacterium sp. LRF_L2]|uniref:class II fructose-bisphosphate aldolase n=1 Tax=Sphingobacterium sp. LRF_L2 TaxID=3369421 RepID=UPI003F62CE76
MIVSPHILFEHCYGQYAIAAINVFTLEQVLGVFRAARAADSPVIIQTTPVARNYAGANVLLEMIAAVAKNYPEVIYAVHLDHGNEAHILHALENGGYASVMIDASHDSFEENIKRTRAIKLKAQVKDIVVEAELGVLSGVEDDLVVDEASSRYTRPADAAAFVERTGCDSLAVAVGTSHGAYKFKGDQGIRFDILADIQRQLPRFPLVLHGGSAVSADDVERINNAGGLLEVGARGVSDEEIARAIPLGICKVNVATDLRILWTRVHREFFKEQPAIFDPIVPGKLYTEALEQFCIQKFHQLGSAGRHPL